MKRLKKWYYLILLLGVGTVYLGYVDNWQVYAGPAEKVRGWYGELKAQNGEGTKGEGTNGGQENLPQEGQPVEDDRTQEKDSGQPVEDIAGAVGDAVKPEGNTEQPEENPTGGGMTEGNNDQMGEGGSEDEEEPENLVDSTPQYMTVEDDYFADAVFIGDSRTVGMFEYGDLEEISTFYASTGLTIFKMFTSEIVSVPGQKKKITIEEALQNNSFAKIYLMIGINEMGTGNVDKFIEKYEEALAHLRELQPDAIIYIQAIMKVTTERSAKGDYINNEGIIERNERIEQLADNEHIFYLDVNPLICDENGGMEPSYTFDGVHLKAKYIETWKQFLKEHAIAQ